MKFQIFCGFVLILILIAGTLHYSRKNDRDGQQTRSFPVMSTAAGITAFGNSPDRMEKALDTAQKKIYEIESICNIFDPESELSILNADAFEKDVSCSPVLWDLLIQADRFYRLSNGAFDVTVKPLMKLWGFHRKRTALPSEAETTAAKKTVGWNKIRLNHQDHSVRFLVKGVGIDLGGIAKGYALDQASRELRKQGIHHAILNLGGNIQCLVPENKNGFKIGVQDPLHRGKTIENIVLRNQSVATSGNYERYVMIQGKQYTHIMDPRTGKPVADMLSVTVITPKGVDSDALSTMIFVQGETAAEKICRTFPDTGVLLIRRDKEKIITRRFGTFQRKK